MQWSQPDNSLKSRTDIKKLEIKKHTNCILCRWKLILLVQIPDCIKNGIEVWSGQVVTEKHQLFRLMICFHCRHVIWASHNKNPWKKPGKNVAQPLVTNISCFLPTSVKVTHQGLIYSNPSFLIRQFYGKCRKKVCIAMSKPTVLHSLL